VSRSKDGSIRLHKTKGLNPRLTRCMDCGKDVGVALLGATDYMYKCRSCGKTTVGVFKHTSKCPQCEMAGGSTEEVPEFAPLPMELCDDCVKKRKEFHDTLVEAAKTGGVAAKCLNCRAQMVVAGSSELAKDTRKRSKIAAPGLVGVEVPECPNCRAKPANELVKEEKHGS